MLSVRSGKLLKAGKNKQGYMNVVLSKDGKAKTHKVHRLVALAFIPNPNNYPFINHKDENKTKMEAKLISPLRKKPLKPSAINLKGLNIFFPSIRRLDIFAVVGIISVIGFFAVNLYVVFDLCRRFVFGRHFV